MAEAHTAAALHAKHYYAVTDQGEIENPLHALQVGMPEIRRLTRSHDELRAALIVASRRIRQLRFRRRNDPVLRLLRTVLRDASGVRVEFKAS